MKNLSNQLIKSISSLLFLIVIIFPDSAFSQSEYVLTLESLGCMAINDPSSQNEDEVVIDIWRSKNKDNNSWTRVRDGLLGRSMARGQVWALGKEFDDSKNYYYQIKLIEKDDNSGDDFLGEDIVYVNAEKTGKIIFNREDAYYQLTYKIEKKEATAPKKHEIRVLTYNVMLLSEFFFPGHRQHSRTDEIVTAISDSWDILVFNEAFLDAARTTLINGMIDKGYTYFTDVPQDGVDEDGGVFVQSKHRIIKTDYLVYSNHAGSDSYSDKGAVYAQIKKDNIIYNIFGTHLQSSHEYDDTRQAQLEELKSFIDSKTSSDEVDNEVIIIAGDLNFDWHRGIERDAAVNILNVYSPPVPTDGYTLDTKANKLAEYRYSGDPKEWLDYIFLSKDGFLGSRPDILTPEMSYEVKKFQSSKSLNYDDGGGSTVSTTELSDHWALSATITLYK